MPGHHAALRKYARAGAPVAERNQGISVDSSGAGHLQLPDRTRQAALPQISGRFVPNQGRDSDLHNENARQNQSLFWLWALQVMQSFPRGINAPRAGAVNMNEASEKSMRQKLGEVVADNKPVLVSVALWLLTLTVIYGLHCIGYSGLSHKIALHVPTVGLVASVLYLYVTTQMGPCWISLLVLILGIFVPEYVEFPEQSSTAVTVVDIDVRGAFLGLNSAYRIETTAGVYEVGVDAFQRGQPLVVKTFASADGFVTETKLCSESQCYGTL